MSLLDKYNIQIPKAPEDKLHLMTEAECDQFKKPIGSRGGYDPNKQMIVLNDGSYKTYHTSLEGDLQPISNAPGWLTETYKQIPSDTGYIYLIWYTDGMGYIGKSHQKFSKRLNGHRTSKGVPILAQKLKEDIPLDELSAEENRYIALFRSEKLKNIVGNHTKS